MLAVLVAMIANFIIGFIWYTPLFGKAWAKELGFDLSVKPPSSVMIRGMLLNLIGNFLIAWVLAHNIGAWGYVPGYTEAGNSANAMSAAFFTWLGFFVPVELSGVAWEKRSWKLFFINVGYHLVALMVVSFILVFWTK
ncbi:MAG: DUF1761 domain-containing protein [Chitinophagales bacterium]